MRTHVSCDPFVDFDKIIKRFNFYRMHDIQRFPRKQSRTNAKSVRTICIALIDNNSDEGNWIGNERVKNNETKISVSKTDLRDSHSDRAVMYVLSHLRFAEKSVNYVRGVEQIVGKFKEALTLLTETLNAISIDMINN